MKAGSAPIRAAIIDLDGTMASARLAMSPAVSAWLNRATGGLFIWLGVKLALTKQH